MNRVQNSEKDTGIKQILLSVYIFATISIGQTDRVIIANVCYGIFALVCIIIIFQNRKLPIFPETKMILLFLGISLISFIGTGINAASVARFRTVILLETIPLLLLSSNCRIYIKNIILSFVLGSFALGIYSMFYGGVSQDSRLNSLTNSNAVGLTLAIASIFCFYYVLSSSSKLCLVLYILGGVLILFSQSKSAVLLYSLFSIITLFIVRNSVKQWKKIFIIFVIAFVLVILYQTNILSQYTVRLSRMISFFSTKNEFYDYSTYMRLDYKRKGIELFLENPILGYGIGQSEIVTNGFYFHDNYIQLLVEFGLIGALIYYLPIVFNLIRAIKLKERLATIILVFLLAADFFNSMYYKKITYILLSISIMLIHNRIQKNAIEEREKVCR